MTLFWRSIVVVTLLMYTRSQQDLQVIKPNFNNAASRVCPSLLNINYSLEQKEFRPCRLLIQTLKSHSLIFISFIHSTFPQNQSFVLITLNSKYF